MKFILNRSFIKKKIYFHVIGLQAKQRQQHLHRRRTKMSLQNFAQFYGPSHKS